MRMGTAQISRYIQNTLLALFVAWGTLFAVEYVTERNAPQPLAAEDIPELALHFIKKASKEGLRAKRIDDQAMALMLTHDWPGNVRELENMIRRLLVLVDDDVIKSNHINAVLTIDPNEKQPENSHQNQLGKVAQPLEAFHVDPSQ